MTSPLLSAALDAHNAGLCVLPPKQNGTKAPLIPWNQYQERRSTEAEIRRWYDDNGRTGIGVVLGASSGNLELLEFDDALAYSNYKAVAHTAGLGAVIERIEAGYLEESPNGIHWLYRCADVGGNTKLARRPKTPDEQKDANDRVKALIETRGAGGFAIIAPSHGTVHPTGRPYKLLRGGYPTIATITAAERETLFELARTLDQMPRREQRATVAIAQPADGDERPGDWFNRTTTWPQILEPNGWTWLFDHGGESYWRRPGKDSGQSATTNYADSDLLKVFSSSTLFDTETAYTRFAAHAILDHGGDYTAAAKAIRARMPDNRPDRHLEAVPPPLEVPPWADDDDMAASEWDGDEPPGDQPQPEAAAGREPGDNLGIDFYTAAQLAHEVDNAPPVGWLIRPLWPADAYGVLAAEKKAGKTWANLDLVISVASNTPWMGAFPIENPGRVVVFLGEGGKRKMLRRLRAICAAKQVTFETLDINLCFRAPHLTDAGHLTRISEEVGRAPCSLVVVDPLYLAARGAKASQLYEMGEHLERIQTVVQAHDAALAIIHHWNKTGEGKGADRMSGVGPAEWGRVLGSAAVLTKHTDDTTKETSVVLDWEFTGDEIPETDIRIRRRVWADNPDDLDSPLHYHVELLEGDAATPDAVHPNLSKSQRRVLAVLEATGDWLNTTEIGDALVGDTTGIPLKKRTIQQALKELNDAGLARPFGDNAGTAYSWSAMHHNATESEHERF